MEELFQNGSEKEELLGRLLTAWSMTNNSKRGKISTSATNNGTTSGTGKRDGKLSTGNKLKSDASANAHANATSVDVANSTTATTKEKQNSTKKHHHWRESSVDGPTPPRNP